MPYTDSEITGLLKEWSDGQLEALDELMPLVFDDIRDIASKALAHESSAHTLQTTALVNEVYLRLVGRRSVRWKNRAQFFGTLAHLMRRILVDHARRHLSVKRGSGAHRISLDESLRLSEARHPDLVALDDALRDLARIDPRQSRIVELRFFVGLTQTEVADVLALSLTTVERDWQMAKSWLRRELSQRPRTSPGAEDP